MQEQPKSVVIVDDELALVAILCEVLEDEKITAVACDHGEKVLECISRERPSLVVLDVQMPGLDGIEIFRLMRASPVTETTPVIFFTANSHLVRERLPEYQTQNAALMAKPFEIESFIDLVHSFIDQI